MTKDEFFEKNQKGFEHYETIPGFLLCTDIELCKDCYYRVSIGNTDKKCQDLKEDWQRFKRKLKLKKLLEK